MYYFPTYVSESSFLKIQKTRARLAARIQDTRVVQCIRRIANEDVLLNAMSTIWTAEKRISLQVILGQLACVVVIRARRGDERAVLPSKTGHLT
jgi:hypothetical protein